MKCIILAAGYATRLYPVTENFPKPLLEVQGRSILDRLTDDLKNVPQIEEMIVVSNHKFYHHFLQWKESVEAPFRLTVIDDGSTDNDNRLGAVKDIAFAIENQNIKEDILVMAGDNLLDFSVKGFVDFYLQKKAACIMCHYEPSVEKLHRTGVAILDQDNRVLLMQEKPAEPQSHWAVPPFYIYPGSDLEYILEGIASGECSMDAPGSFIAWFCQKAAVYAYPMPGKRYDIGDMASYQEIQMTFREISVTK